MKRITIPRSKQMSSANLIVILLALVALTSNQAASFQQQQQVKRLEEVREDNGAHPAPEPYSFAYSAESIGGLSTHEERGDGSGRVSGFYTIQDADGRERRVDYVADENGYRANVRTNEVGTRAEAAADAQYEVQLPSAKQLEAAKISYEQYKYLEEQHQVERERSRQAHQSRHSALKQQVVGQQQQQQQQVLRQNQLGQQSQQAAYSLDSKLAGSAPLFLQSAQQNSATVAAESAQFGSPAPLSLANDLGNPSNNRPTPDTFLAPVPQSGASREQDSESYLYENSWRQAQAPSGSARFQAIANQRDSLSAQSAGSSFASNTIVAGRPAPLNSAASQATWKASFAVNNQQQALGNGNPIGAQTNQQQQQIPDEPAWKTLARLGGTTKRPVTVLQRQLEQQFMQVATQLTDQDYPRLEQTTPAPQQFQAPVSQQVALEQRNTSSERPVIPSPVWRPVSDQTGSYQANQQVNLVSGGVQSAPEQPAELGQQINQQQNNIINDVDDAQVEDGRAEQVSVQQDNVGQRQQQQQQQFAALSSTTKKSEPPITTPPGFVSINLSDSVDTNREEPTVRPLVSAVPTGQQQDARKVVQAERVEEKQQEEVSVSVGEQSSTPSLPQQAVQQQLQLSNSVNFQEPKTTKSTILEQQAGTAEPLPARPVSVNQIIESITRQPAVTVTPQRFLKQQSQSEEQQAVKGGATVRFTGMIMRSTSAAPISTTVPAIFRQETTTTTSTTTSAPFRRQEDASTVRYLDRYFQPTTTASPVSRQVGAQYEAAQLSRQGVKGASKMAPSSFLSPALPGPRRSQARVNAASKQQVQFIAATTPESQTLPAITTRAPARGSQVEFAVQQTNYLPAKQVNQSSISYEVSQPIAKQQFTTTTSYLPQSGAKNQLDTQQWKGIKGGARSGLKKQFWQSASESSANERAYSAASSASRFQAPQINQSSRLTTNNYAADGSSSGFGFGSRIASAANTGA